MNRQFVREMPETTDQKETWNWLRKADLKVETEAMLCAVQELAIRTNYVKHMIDKTAQSTLCRTCYKKSETISHVVSGSRGTWYHIKETEEMYRRTGSCYKHSITAENSTARDSLYIKEGFKLQIRFVETGLRSEKKLKKECQIGRGREIVPKLNRLERM